MIMIIINFSFIPDTGGFTYQIREYNSATVYTYDSSVQTIQFRIVLEAGSSGKQKARYYYSYDGGSESNVLGSREISNGTFYMQDIVVQCLVVRL